MTHADHFSVLAGEAGLVGHKETLTNLCASESLWPDCSLSRRPRDFCHGLLEDDFDDDEIDEDDEDRDEEDDEDEDDDEDEETETWQVSSVTPFR